MSSRKPTPSAEEAVTALPRRLCSEIQLFDLCELERCTFKDDRFCTDPEMLARFEAEAEPEDRPVWHFEKDASDDADDDENGLYPEDEEEDEEGYSVYDDEDRLEQDDTW